MTLNMMHGPPTSGGGFLTHLHFFSLSFSFCLFLFVCLLLLFSFNKGLPNMTLNMMHGPSTSGGVFLIQLLFFSLSLLFFLSFPRSSFFVCLLLLFSFNKGWSNNTLNMMQCPSTSKFSVLFFFSFHFFLSFPFFSFLSFPPFFLRSLFVCLFFLCFCFLSVKELPNVTLNMMYGLSTSGGCSFSSNFFLFLFSLPSFLSLLFFFFRPSQVFLFFCSSLSLFLSFFLCQ